MDKNEIDCFVLERIRMPGVRPHRLHQLLHNINQAIKASSPDAEVRKEYQVEKSLQRLRMDGLIKCGPSRYWVMV